MNSGKLFEAVAFDSPTLSADAYGGTENGWAEEFTTRANFKYLRGGETVMSARLQGKQPVVVTIRAHEKAQLVDPSYRMRDTRRGHEYNIRSVVPSDDRAFIEITAERGVAL